MLSTETSLFTKDITDLTHSEWISTSTSSFLPGVVHTLQQNPKLIWNSVLRVKDLVSLYFGPLERMSLSLLVLSIVRSTVMM